MKPSPSMMRLCVKCSIVTPCFAAALSASARADGDGACGWVIQPVHEAPTAIMLLATGEIDAAHPGLELIAVQADGVILRLNRDDAGWSAQPLPITVEPAQIMNIRPTINIGDVHPGFAGNEIVVETFNTVHLLVQPSPGQWQRQIVLDGNEFFGNVWGVRIGEIDPARPGDELFYITETAFDVSAGWCASLVGGTWTSQLVFNAEVGMDAAIGDANASTPGNETIVGTEMGPVYEITPQPGNPQKWPMRTLWNDFTNAPWTLRIADILPDVPGNEIAYGSRYTDRLLLSRAVGDAHDMEVIFTGQATEAMTMWDIAVGDVVPASKSLEIVGVDELGMVYMAEYDGDAWSGRTLWQDPGGGLYASVIADYLPSAPGPEIIVAGASGAITLIARQQPTTGDINCDGMVDIDDLLAAISAWGPCAPPPMPCPADVDRDGDVDIDDLLLVLANWG